MKFLLALIALFAVATLCIPQDTDEPLDRDLTYSDLAGQEYTFDQLREAFKSAEGILAGQYNASAPFSKNGTGVSPQSLVQFERGFKTFRGRFPAFEDGGKRWHLMFYEAEGESQLDEMKENNRYILLIPKLYDREQVICLEETETLLSLMKVWTQKGIYSEADIEQLTDDSDWIVTVKLTGEVCAESYPCQHHWDFKVIERIKGEDIPDQITIHGNYRGHHEIPFELKPSRGKFRLFLKQDADLDTDVIARMPVRK